jgi:hypothetical protein
VQAHGVPHHRPIEVEGPTLGLDLQQGSCVSAHSATKSVRIWDLIALCDE